MLVLALGAAAFCLGPSLVGVRTLISVDSLTNFLPWSVAGNRSVGHELCQSDTIDSVLPSAAYIRHQVYSGHLAAWQSLQSGGGPLGSLPNAGMLDPLSLPYWVLPLSWAPAFVILLTWVAGIGGTFLFLRRLAVGRPAATLAGFVFATSGFMVMWSNWPQARTAALIPALFWATDRVATRSRLSDLVLLAVVVAAMLLGGFPEVTGFALYMAGTYLLVRVLYRHRRGVGAAVRPLALGAGGLALGGALSAVQMLPFLDFYRTDDLAYRSALSTQGLPLPGLLTLVAPNTDGLCIIGRGVHGYPNPVELVAYVGAAALVLAVAGAAFAVGGRRPHQAGVRGFLAGAVVLAVLVCWVSPVAHSAVASLPVFSGNFIGRIRCVVGFGLAALAGFGFDWLTTRRGVGDGPAGAGPRGWDGFEWSRAVWPGFVCVETALFGLAVIRAGYQDALDGRYLKAWTDAVSGPLGLVAASVVLVTAAGMAGRVAGPATGRRARDVAFLALPVLVVIQGSQFFHTVMPGDHPQDFYPVTADHAFLTAHLGHDRFASANLALYPATAFYYGLRSATGHQFNDGRWNTLLTTVDPNVMATPTDSNFSGDINSGDIAHQPILDQMGVKYFVLPPTDVAGVPVPSAGSPASGAAAGASIFSGRGAFSCRLAGGPLRGVALDLTQPLTPAARLGGATIKMTLSGPGYERVSGLYLSSRVPAGSTVVVPVAGEDLPAGGAAQARFTVAGAAGPLAVTGTAGSAACTAVRPRADGLKLVYAGPGAVIYQRDTALPRIRWASTAEVVADPAAQLEDLRRGIPASSVLLSRPAPAGSGQPASVSVGRDDGDGISAGVNAAGGGYLLVADPMQVPGWSARVDGRPALLRAADYAMVAVWVPPGTHTVTFTYRAPGQLPGAGVTAAGILTAIGLVWWDRRRAGRRDQPAHSARARHRTGRSPVARVPLGP